MSGLLMRYGHCLLLLLATLAGRPVGAAEGITLDGEFEDWAGVPVTAVDVMGDATFRNGVDFGRLWLTNDAERLLIRLEVGRETLIQENRWKTESKKNVGNGINLYIDGDNSGKTGRNVDEIDEFGAELSIHYGRRSARFYDAEGRSTDRYPNAAGSIIFPTHSGEVFEFQVPFTSVIDGRKQVTVISGPTIRLFFEDDDGDRLPEEGTLSYTLATEAVAGPEPILLGRMAESDVRVLVHNVRNSGIKEKPEPFARYLRALRPDIINFQEVGEWDAKEAIVFVSGLLEPAPGETWHAAQVADTMTLSKWPIVSQGAVDENLVCLIDPPESASPRDLVIFNAHTPCCDDQEGRDREHDNLAAAWREMLNGGTGAPFAIDPSSPVIMCGDFNMVGFVRQIQSLRDGNIFNNVRTGPNFAPGRADGSLLSAPLRHTHSRQTYTWRHNDSNYSPGKLDYVFYSGDVMTLRRNFALFTREMPPATLAAHGLEAGDSEAASDHLVLVADFSFGGVE